MISKRRCEQIVDLIVSYAGDRARGVEVQINGADQSTARFANNEMTQHVSGSSVSVTVGIQLPGKTALFSGDDLSARGLRKLVDTGIEYAAQLPYDGSTLRLIKPSERTGDIEMQAALTAARFDPKLSEVDEKDRVKVARAIFDVARRYRMKAAGIYQTSEFVFATGNSEGVFRYATQTGVESSITMQSGTSSGWQKAFGPTLKSVDPVALAVRAAQIAARGRNPVYVRPGVWTVILEPSAVLDLIGFLWDDFSGTNHWDKTSCFARKVGKRALGKNITIRDDVYHPLQFGFAFDDEGMNREVVPLVENGVIRKPVKSRRAVKHLGGKPTGHGFGMPSGEGEAALNLVMDGGDATVDEMVASTERGLLMTRVWYVRDVDPNTKLLTGMTRDGTFLIENGKVVRGVKNMRFNQSVIEMLRNVVELGKPVLAAGEETFPAVVPAMKIDGFRFSSKTKG